MDSNLYLKHNRAQIEISKKFCIELATDPDWSETHFETVMDIGCGPGNASTCWIDHYFPDIERLIGIDIDPGMIRLANEHNRKKKIEFYVADIMKKESLKQWENRIDRIFSTFVFHRVSDQKEAFRNVFDLLTSSGIASLVFMVTGSFYLAYMDLLHTEKWKSLLEGNLPYLEAVDKSYDKESYKQMFEDIGFRVPFCETIPIAFTYESDKECKNLLLSLHTIGDMSDELEEEYIEDLFKQYLKHSPRDSEGKPTHNAVVLQVKLVKDAAAKKNNACF